MIGLVLPTHTHDPLRLLQSIQESAESVCWYIFHHSTNEAVERRIIEFSKTDNVNLYLYRKNRGLARSWNEGIHRAYQDGCELTLVLNDDLHFIEGGFQAFVDHLRANPGFGLGFLKGIDRGGAFNGQAIVQGLACFAMGHQCLNEIGYFDETFTPAYYEDMDYLRRMRLAGCSQTVAEGVIGSVRGRGVNSRTALAGIGVAIGPCG